MRPTITRIRCRHRQQAQGTPDLILTVGEPLPGLYQIQRPSDALVKRIEASPYRCSLTNGEDILIPDESVLEVIESSDA